MKIFRKFYFKKSNITSLSIPTYSNNKILDVSHQAFSRQFTKQSLEQQWKDKVANFKSNWKIVSEENNEK